jgi:CRP/FNR family cyclic AMP-dependent transcriptional regulator
MIYLSCSAHIEEGVTVIQPWFLNSTDFYERISKEDLEVFRRICLRQHYQKGSYIFRSGDPASELHLIEEGRVKLVSLTPTGGTRILAFSGHGDFIGEAFLKEKNRYRVDAVALSEVATCAMSRTQFLQLTEERVFFALIFAEMLADQLDYCRNTLSDSYGSVKLRVAKVLLQQAQHFGKPLEEAGWVASTCSGLG